ncbi:unnamed protein product, partial [Effrenium voratum]
MTRQQVLESPNDLLELEGLKLMFEPQDASSTSYFHGCNSDFESLTVPTNCIELYWETDGDGRHDPESRWGVFALITADKGKPVDQSVLDSLTDKYLIETLKAKGHEGNISVEPEDWDETRLRALCARHGWQFEWMTE